MRLFLILTLSSLFCVYSADAQSPGSTGGKGPFGSDWADCILISEQRDQRFAIVDVKKQAIIWEWKASGNLPGNQVNWFSNPSDAKLVYNNTHILATASGGGVILIRIADKKIVFYTFVGGNTHSAELLPDGNIVSASSTGNYLTLIRTDTTSFPENVLKRNIPVDFGHNVVWDRKRQLLWTAARHHIHAYTYNFDCSNPDLKPERTIDLPGAEGHDLFPVYGSDELWLTNTTDVYRFDTRDAKLLPANDFNIRSQIKSVSSGVSGRPVIVIKPKQSWWTDEILDPAGRRIYFEEGLKIYKARWALPVPFSYPENNNFKLCY